MRDESRARARDRALFQLKQRGPQTAAALARRLGISRVAVRQHLAALEAERLVAFVERRGSVGRPARLWQVTERAAPLFPDAHADMAVELLSAMRASFGEQGLDRILARRTRAQLALYRSRLPGPGAPLETRVAALAAVRSEEGYMAEWSREGDDLLLLENHCPVCAAARACQGLCREELALFRRVLGDDARVERTDHLLAGARRCAYRIRAQGTRPKPERRRGRAQARAAD